MGRPRKNQHTKHKDELKIDEKILTDTKGLEAELIDVLKVAAILGVSKNTIFDLTATGRIPPPIRITPRCLRWRRSELAKKIAEVR